MTTNKKKSTKDKSEKTKKTSTASPPKTIEKEPATIMKKGIFQSSQFIALVLLAMGVSRLLEVRAASLPESQKCIGYLGTAACNDPMIRSLVSLKFQFAIQVTVMVVQWMLMSWKTERMLAQINGLLVLSPIMAGMAVLLSNGSIIPDGAAKGQCLIAIVLALLSLPPPQNRPFSGPRVAKWYTIPSLIFATLTIISIGQAVHCILDSFDRIDTIVEGLLPWEPHFVALQPAARPIIQFFAVDYLLMGLLYAYAFHSFPDATQRALLIRLTMIKTGEAFYQLPMFGDTFQVGMWQSIAVGTSLLCGAGCISPRIA